MARSPVSPWLPVSTIFPGSSGFGAILSAATSVLSTTISWTIVPVLVTWKVILPLGTVAWSRIILLSVSVALTILALGLTVGTLAAVTVVALVASTFVAPVPPAVPHAARSRTETVAAARRVFIVLPFAGAPDRANGGFH